MPDHPGRVGQCCPALRRAGAPAISASSSPPILSKGRASWNLVTGADEIAAANFSRDAYWDTEKRYDWADEFVAATKALWDGGARPGTADARVSGIPGAVPVDLATELAGLGGGTKGNRPLPEIAELQANARRWGIRNGAPVVVYDDRNGLQAGRAWWVLRWAGIEDVRLLDGGLGSWLAAGFATTELTRVPDLGNVQLSAGHLPTLDADAAARQAREGILLDARDSATYERSGHIPGALSAPAKGNLAAGGTFAPADELRARYAALGVFGSSKVGISCGAGVSAAHDIIALASLGYPASLFVGSWSAWSADPSRPVATGSGRG